MTALFIDADNLCSTSWVEDAIQILEKFEGAISVRRAYGSAEKLKGLGDVLRAALIRPYMNLSLSKNTTDIALAVDVMELSYASTPPSTIVIGSGDADFVPLVLRLRERGFRMICISERGKMAPEAVYAYDKVFLVGEGREPEPEYAVTHSEEKNRAPEPRISAPAKKSPAKKAAASKVATTTERVKAQTATKKAVAKKVPTKKASPTSEGAPNSLVSQVTVHQILDSAPALAGGQFQPLGEVAKQLHDAKLLGKNAASTKLFKKFPHHFELQPTKQPNRIRYVLPPEK